MKCCCKRGANGAKSVIIRVYLWAWTHGLTLLNGKDSRKEPGAEINRQWRRAFCRQPKAKGIICLLNKIFSLWKKKNTVFTELNDRLVKLYYRDKSESFFQVNGVEFVLTISHYCNVLTIETIKLVFKPLDILWLFRITRKSHYVCPKS